MSVGQQLDLRIR